MIRHVFNLFSCPSVLILALAILGGCATYPVKESDESTCLLSKPPENSKLVSTHGVGLLIAPISIPKNFTGCQSAWLESGELLMRSRFSQGTILTADIIEPDEEKITCTYLKGALSSGSPDKCLAPLKLIK